MPCPYIIYSRKMNNDRRLTKMQILNKTKNTLISSNVTIADTFISRMIGLLNRKSLAEQEALIITKCNSIHMFFMKFPIDVLFVDKNNIVVGLLENIKPFHLSPIFFKSSYVIELPVEQIETSSSALGDVIEIVK